MEVILLENIKNLGSLGKQVKVKPGYARNYLLAKQKAVIANAENIKYFDKQKEGLLKQENIRIQNLKERAATLDGMQITLAALVSDEGKLYGSITVSDIVNAITAAGVEIKKNEVFLPHGTIKEIGIYDIQLGLNHGEINATIKLNIVSKAKV